MVVDTGIRESLIEAGLVDPQGNFTSPPNFGGPSEAGGPVAPRLQAPAEGEGAQEGQEQPAQPDPFQAQPSQPAQAPQGSAPQGSDLGPQSPQRLGTESDPVRQEYEQTVAQLDHLAELAFMQGRTLVGEDGQRLYSDEQLAAKIGQELQAAKQQAYLAGVMKRMQPVAKRAAAEQIAKEHGVEVDDIINEESPVAMQTRAKTIAELKRDGRFQERKKNGTDTAEGSRGYSSAIPEAIERMSPQQKMYIGFARGDH